MTDDYRGFELGPIRPPSEAHSLLLRVTRNCPWNRCRFCGLYRGETFSVRPVDHVIRDIDTARHYVDEIARIMHKPPLRPGSGSQARRGGPTGHKDLMALQARTPERDLMALQAVLTWIQGGMTSVFLQDANSLAVRPDHLVAILDHLRRTFPQVTRVTSYARSRSVARISDGDMARLAAAGLNRIHIGLESGADEVLDAVDKGVDKKTHIVAGRKVKAAGIELSEYFMPGLGGARLSCENATETADAMNRIDPDFIRIRTLAIPEQVELYRDVQAGDFTPLGDVEMAGELLLFLENLDGITSTVKSDHILNLLQEVEGRLPEDRERMTAPIRKFLALPAGEQLLYMVGRRSGIFARLEDMRDPVRVRHADDIRASYRVTLDNYGDFTAGMMRRFI